LSTEALGITYSARRWEVLDLVDKDYLGTIPVVRPNFQFHRDWIEKMEEMGVVLTEEEKEKVQESEQAFLTRPVFSPMSGFNEDRALLALRESPQLSRSSNTYYEETIEDDVVWERPKSKKINIYMRETSRNPQYRTYHYTNTSPKYSRR